MSKEKIFDIIRNMTSKNIQNNKEEEFERLQKFSEEIINLGKEIGAKLKEKTAIDEELFEKEKEVRLLQTEIYQLKEKSIKLNLELSKLEQRRRELAGS